MKKPLFLGLKQHLPYLLILGVLLLMLVASEWYIRSSIAPVTLTREFNKVVLREEKQLMSTLSQVIRQYDTSCLPAAHSWVNTVNKLTLPPDVSLLIYRNGKLEFWTDNLFQPGPYPKFSSHQGVLAGKLGNGWYLLTGENVSCYRFIIGKLIKAEYSINNEFLKDRFTPAFDLADGVEINDQPGGFEIRSASGAFLFSLAFDHPVSIGGAWPVFQYLLLLGIFIVFSIFSWKFCQTSLFFSARPNLVVFLFIAGLFVLRFLQQYFRLPHNLYDQILFSPSDFSSSAFIPSLGDFMLTSILAFISGLVFNRKFTLHNTHKLRGRVRNVIVVSLLMAVLVLMFIGLQYLTSSLIVNSSFSLLLQDISGFTGNSGLGLLILILCYFSFWLISSKILSELFDCVLAAKSSSTQTPIEEHLIETSVIFLGKLPFINKRRKQTIIIPAGSIFIAVLFYVAGLLKNPPVPLVVPVMFAVFVMIYWWLNSGAKSLVTFPKLVVFIAFFSLFGAFTMNRANKQKEDYKTDLLINKLVGKRNPITEVKFEQLRQQMLKETGFWSSKVQHLIKGEPLPDTISEIIRNRFFQGYWKQYDIQITICDSTNTLAIQPRAYQVNCQWYFKNMIAQNGRVSPSRGFYFIDYGYGQESYLAIFSFREFFGVSPNNLKMYVELNSNPVTNDPGFPGLLTDSRDEIGGLSIGQSFAIYSDDKLVYSMGNHHYPVETDFAANESPVGFTFKTPGMVHNVYRLEPSSMLVISSEKQSLLTAVAPFSYLFFLFAMAVIVFAWIKGIIHSSGLFPQNMRNRLYLIFIGILVLTLVVTGIIQVVNLLSINAKKDIDDLRDRTASIRIEVQHKFGKATTFSDLTAEQVGDFLIKLSNVFFTDINCFDTTGLLVSTSRPGLFNSGIMTERINPAAFTKLISEKSSVLVQQEIVGEMTYYSAYMPLYNDQNDLFGYVNLPYFSKQDESKRDIASFMVTFLNIYILLMLIGIVITIMISDYFTASLVLLTGKLSRLRLDKRNEKIDWKTDDEIGKLVSEYNRMVDELENSAKLLAQSERESAWREMARQVAHEIKNPLTPLKLSAQHLQKAWNEKSPGIDQRINRFLSTLVAQIDALSEIATDFSDFAKMPQMELMRVDVEDVLQFVLSMYPESTAIHYKLLTDGVPRHANADKAQLTRVFTNLINNAVQSFAEDQKGQIIIELSGDNHHVCVSVSDNGSGVPGNKAQEIFKPGFTTKTTGMGLGLAIVKTILNDLGGEISYHPNNDKGSVFTVKIPVWKTARE